MNMDKKLKRMFAVCLAVCLTICSVFSSGEWQGSAAKKKVKLEKKLVNVYVGNTVRIKLKNNKKKTKYKITNIYLYDRKRRISKLLGFESQRRKTNKTRRISYVRTFKMEYDQA